MFIFFKFISSIGIVGISSYLGYLKSKSLANREYILREMIIFLNLVKTEISYTYNILPNVFEISRNKLNTGLKEVIGSIAVDMLKGKENIKENINNLNDINRYEKDVFETALLSLGKSDVDSQVAIINKTTEILESLVVDAKDVKDKNSKMYKTLGMVTGLIFVIIFI